MNTYQATAAQTLNADEMKLVESVVNKVDSYSIANVASQRNSAGMDSMSQKCMAGSKPVIAKSGFDKRGTDKWLDKRPA
jgi:hypothetical protein